MTHAGRASLTHAGRVTRAPLTVERSRPTRAGLLAALDLVLVTPSLCPSISPLAMTVLERARQPEVPLEEFGELISVDLAFAEQVTNLAASPVHDPTSPIRNISQAVSRLGIQTVTDLCLEVALSQRLFRAPEFDLPMEAIRRHCVSVGHIARQLLIRAGAKPHDAFLLGLLHDTGVAAGVLALRAPGFWSRRIEIAEAWSTILLIHGELTARLLAFWSVGRSHAGALRIHHDLSMPRTQEHAALVLADHLAAELGRGLPEIEGHREVCGKALLARCRELIGMPHARQVAVAFEVTKLLDQNG